MKNKFRVWCKNRNEWERNETYIDQNGDLWCWQSNRLITVRKETHTIEQCTGLKDKNDKLIYEGDILKFEHCEWSSEQIDMVKWYGAEHYPAFDLADGVRGESNALQEVVASGEYDCEIIGNIHENPEPLEV